MADFSKSVFWIILFAGAISAIGYATPGWQKNGRMNNGLWENCVCLSKSSNQEDWMAATQALTTIGLICIGVAFILEALNALCTNRCFHFLIAIACIGACVCFVIASAIYGAKMKNHLHYSYAFIVIGAVFSLFAGVVKLGACCNK